MIAKVSLYFLVSLLCFTFYVYGEEVKLNTETPADMEFSISPSRDKPVINQNELLNSKYEEFIDNNSDYQVKINQSNINGRRMPLSNNKSNPSNIRKRDEDKYSSIQSNSYNKYKNGNQKYRGPYNSANRGGYGRYGGYGYGSYGRYGGYGGYGYYGSPYSYIPIIIGLSFGSYGGYCY